MTTKKKPAAKPAKATKKAATESHVSESTINKQMADKAALNADMKAKSEKVQKVLKSEQLKLDAAANGINLDEWLVFHPDILRRLAPFASHEKTRYYLNGVCFDGTTKKPCAVSTDGHRMAIIRMDDHECHIPNGKFLVETVDKRLLKMIEMAEKQAGRNVPVTIAIKIKKTAQDTIRGDAYMVMGMGVLDAIMAAKGDGLTLLMSCRNVLIDGTYPDWERVLPKPTKPITDTKGTDLERLRNDNSRLTDEVKKLKVHTFNAKYVTAFLEAVPKRERMMMRAITMHHVVNDHTSPVLICIDGLLDFVGILMPMRGMETVPTWHLEL